MLTQEGPTTFLVPPPWFDMAGDAGMNASVATPMVTNDHTSTLGAGARIISLRLRDSCVIVASSTVVVNWGSSISRSGRLARF